MKEASSLIWVSFRLTRTSILSGDFMRVIYSKSQHDTDAMIGARLAVLRLKECCCVQSLDSIEV